VAEAGCFRRLLNMPATRNSTFRRFLPLSAPPPEHLQ
jgi:hypothetical protein